MSENSTKKLQQILSAERMAELDKWIDKYPAEEKQSAVMAALRLVQDEYSYLTPELMDAVAQYLDMPPIAVYEVGTFYSMYQHRPLGRHLINVCTNISCKLSGSANLVATLESDLGIKMGETTSDGRFTLRSVECLGACVNAPMMQVDKDYHENLDAKKVQHVLEQYK